MEKPNLGELVASYSHANTNLELRHPPTEPSEEPVDPRQQRLEMFIVVQDGDKLIHHPAKFGPTSYASGLISMVADVLEGEEPQAIKPVKLVEEQTGTTPETPPEGVPSGGSSAASPTAP